MPRRALLAALVAALLSSLGCILMERDVTLLATDPPPPRSDARHDIALTVVTLNVHDLYLAARDRPERMRLIGAALAGLDVDVVSLQEAFIRADREVLLRELEGSPLAHHAYFDYGKVGSGLLVLSAHPIVETDFLEFSDKGKWYKPWHGDWWAGKGVALVRIRLPGGDVDVFHTHAHAAYGRTGADDEYLSVRVAQHRELLAFIDETKRPANPVLAVGDFNCATGSPEYDVLIGEGELEPMLTIATRFDHVFAKASPCFRYESEPTRVIRSAAIAGREPRRLSDHEAYVARITIDPQACAEAAAR